MHPTRKIPPPRPLRPRGLLGMLGLLAAAGCGSGPATLTAQKPLGAPGPRAVVLRFVDAFNRHDPEAMAAMVAPDFVWLSVAGDSVSADVRGPDGLAAAMRDYFASLPSARSAIEGAVVSGSFVALRERARWTTPAGEPRSQAALAVYEVRNGLIRRAWYYPAQP